MGDIDHREMTPIYVRQVYARRSPAGDEWAAVWDVRLAKANKERVPAATLHSLEHFLGAAAREEHGLNMNTRVVFDVSVLGCQTGLKLVTLGLWSSDEVQAWLAEKLETIGTATAVPMANIIECGSADMHSLDGAQDCAARMLDERDGWNDHGSHEIRPEDLAELAAAGTGPGKGGE
jgi:S-ribosylhomocysteine lyase